MTVFLFPKFSPKKSKFFFNEKNKEIFQQKNTTKGIQNGSIWLFKSIILEK